MKIYKISVIALMVLIVQIGYGQVTVDDNVPVTGRWVGFDNFSGIPLPIENRGFPEIDISSAGTNKFAITELATWNGLNSLTLSDVQRTTLGLQGESNLAWSMLHLWSGTLPAEMQRDWMNVGTSYTANIDYMYSGLLERPNTGGNDLATDAVVAWGCQPETTQNGNTDNFRFLFLEGFSGIPNRAAQTQQGREMMRISPVGNVGIGDFSSNGYGLAEQPTFRLDVDGTARLRQVPFNDTADVFITGRQVDALGDYVLTYIPFDDVSFSDCRWQDIPSATGIGANDMMAGNDPLDPCYRQNVVIWAPGAKAKLHVEADTDRDNSPTGVLFDITDSQQGFDASNTSNIVSAVYANASGINASLGIDYVGLQGYANFGRNAVGVDARARSGGNSFGVYSIAANALNGVDIGVYSEVPSSGVSFFAVGGTQITTGFQINISDENVKSNIAPMENASEILNQLSAKTYEFVSPDNRELGFQIGN